MQNVAITDIPIDDNFVDGSLVISSVIDSNNNTLEQGVDYSITNLGDGIIVNSVAPGVSIIVEIKIQVKQPLENTDVDKISNQAQVCVVEYCEPSEIVDVPFAKDLSITKENINNEDGLANAGEILRYQIVVKNESDIIVNNVEVSDLLSDVNFTDNVTIVSIKDSQTNDVPYTLGVNNNIIFDAMPAGETYTIEVDIEVSAPLNDQSQTHVSNTARVCLDDVCKDSNEVEVPFSADFSIMKANVNNPDNLADAGETLYYDITVENLSDIDLVNVKVSDLFTDANLENLQLINVTDKDDNEVPVNTYQVDLNNNIITFDKMVVGDKYVIHLSADVKDPLANTGVKFVENQAKAQVGEEVKESNKVEVPFIISYDILKANVNNEDNLADVGEVLEYEITVVNDSPIQLNNVEVKDNLIDVNLEANSLTLLSIKDSSDQTVDSSTYTAGSNSIIFTSIPANESYTIKLSVKVTSPLVADKNDSITNIASICFEENCDNSEKVEVPFVSGFEVVKSNVNNEDNIVSEGEVLYYDVAVTNTGAASIENLEVIDPLNDPNFDPATFTVINVTDEADDEVTDYTLSGNTIKFASIPPASTYTIHLQVQVFSPLVDATQSDLKNKAQACVGEDCTDSNEVVVPLEKEIAVIKTNINNEDGAVDAGERLYYQLDVENRGLANLENVTLTDEFSNENFDQSTIKIEEVLNDEGDKADASEYEINDLTKEITFFNINSAKKYTVIVSVEVDGVLDDPTLEFIDNQATVCLETEECMTTPPVELPFNIDYSITKENINNEDGVITSDETLTYSFEVTNSSPIILTDVEVSDPFDDEAFDATSIELIQIQDDMGETLTHYTFDKLNGRVIFDMQPNTTYTIVMTVELMKPLETTKDYVINQGQLCVEEDCIDSNEVIVPFSQDFEVAKINVDNEDGLVEAGETLYYQILVKNTSPIAIKNVRVTDEIDDPAVLKETLEFVSVLNEQGQIIDDVTFDTDSKEVIIASIPSGETYSVVFKVKVKEAVDSSKDHVSNIGKVCLGEVCKDTEEVKTQIKVILPVNKVNIKNEDDFVSNSETLYYRIVIKNEGLNTQENVKITDNFSNENFILDTVKLVSIRNENGEDITEYEYSGNTMVLGKIYSQEVITVVLSAKVKDELIGDKVVNTVELCNSSEEICEEATSEVPIKNKTIVDDVLTPVKPETPTPDKPTEQPMKKGILSGTGKVILPIIVVLIIVGVVIVILKIRKNKKK